MTPTQRQLKDAIEREADGIVLDVEIQISNSVCEILNHFFGVDETRNGMYQKICPRVIKEVIKGINNL